jgi:hypothetical protein
LIFLCYYVTTIDGKIFNIFKGLEGKEICYKVVRVKIFDEEIGLVVVDIDLLLLVKVG